MEEQGRLRYKKRGTGEYLILNSKEEALGFLKIENVGRHRHWVWHQYGSVGMSGGCLDDLRKIMRRLYGERKC